MGVVQRFERRVEELVNGAFARAFKSEVQPVEIASALQRECDDRAAIVSRDRIMVPNTYIVELGPQDHERLSVYAETLCAELNSMLREHVAEQGYRTVGPVTVRVECADGLETGVFRVRSRAIAGTGQPTRSGVPYLEVNGEPHEISAPVTVIGRGGDADLRLDDPGVSRRHAEVRLREPQRRLGRGRGSDREAAVVLDLGSTNGIFVGGRRVPEAELHDGDSMVLGSTTVVFRAGNGRS